MVNIPVFEPTVDLPAYLAMLTCDDERDSDHYTTARETAFSAFVPPCLSPKVDREYQ
jgi:hypothetical protein